MKLDLSDPGDAELLSFILDATIERWKEELPSDIACISEDMTITSLEEMLELTGSMSEMIKRAERMRDQLTDSLREGLVNV